MIEPPLNIVKDKLDDYLKIKLGNNVRNVFLGNIASFELGGTSIGFEDKIIISLVNIEEESTLKNNTFLKRNALTGGVDYIDPPVHLNLYLLFSSVPAASANNNRDDSYRGALQKLSWVVQFFQHQKRFNSIINLSPTEEVETQLIFELYTLTFEQINHLWGSLGGKQLPFVMYKARLIRIQENQKRSSTLIEEINSDLSDSKN